MASPSGLAPRPAGVVGIAFVVESSCTFSYWRRYRRGSRRTRGADEHRGRAAAPPSGETGALPEAAPIVLPPLSTSDDFVRAMVEKLSAHPVLASFVVTEQLVRKAVVVVANVAEGLSRLVCSPHLRPEGRSRSPPTRADSSSTRRATIDITRTSTSSFPSILLASSKRTAM